MHRTHTMTILTAGLATMTAAAYATVDMTLSTADETICVGELLHVDLVFVADGPTPQMFDSTDAVLSWDPAVLQFIEADDSSAEASFFLTGFMPDPDDVNADLSDGDAIYTALVSPGQSAAAPAAPGDLVVTTFVFQALAPAAATDVQLLPTLGAFGESRVLLAGAAITGAIDDTTIGINNSCQGDTNCDAMVNVTDLVNVVLDWGTNGAANGGDVTDDGVVNVTDLVEVILQWGACP